MFGTDATVDFGELLNDLRCHSTEWLAARRECLVREQRRLHVEELAVLAVLDERGEVDDSQAGTDGVRTRDIRRKRKTAQNLKGQPNLAGAAAQGNLSDEQLDHASDLAGDDPDADRTWAQDAPGWSPDDLAAKVREQRTPTPEDAAARRAARMLRYWRNPDHGMVDGRFSLPDVDGATFELVMNDLIEQIRPAKGQPWDTREHRGADALMALIHAYRERRVDETTTVPGAHLIVQVPLSGPATVAGIPLPDAMVETLRANGRVEPVLVDEQGAPIVVGRTESVVSAKTKRVVLQRDGKCRIPGCECRGPLDVHHLWPRSWGGSDTFDNLAAACTGSSRHHQMLVPHGPYLLLGNPNQPDGLVLVHRDDLPALAQLAAEQATHHARAGPEAA